MKRLIVGALVLLGCAGAADILAGVATGRPGKVLEGIAKSDDDKKDYDKHIADCRALEKMPVPWDEERQLGGAVAMALIVKTKGVYVDPAPELGGGKVDMSWANRVPAPGAGKRSDLTRYVAELGKGLAALSGRPQITWNFIVLEADAPNAFSAPGGYVFVTTGLLKVVQNEAQLAGVLAHEISHVVAGHALKAYGPAKAASCELAFKLNYTASAANLSNLVGAWGKAMAASFFDLDSSSPDLVEAVTDKYMDKLVADGNGKGAEHEADKMAYDLVAFAGYDPEEYKTFLQLPTVVRGTDENPVPHPDLPRRIEVLGWKTKEYKEFTLVRAKPPVGPAVAQAFK